MNELGRRFAELEGPPFRRRQVHPSDSSSFGSDPWLPKLAVEMLDVRGAKRLQHLLIDQTEQDAESVTGAAAARLLQIVMMAAFREAPVELLQGAARMIGELYPDEGFEGVAMHVEYVLATQPKEYRKLFSEALQRNVPGRGGEMMNYVEELIERGRQEGRREGRREVVRMIEGFVARDTPWSAIEEATGIDEAAFRRLRQRLDDADDNGSAPTA